MTSSKNDINIEKILDYIPNESQIRELGAFFKSFSDSTRLKIISCLSIKNLCVNEISNLLQMNQTTISHQLKELKSQKIIYSKKSGKTVIYSLSNKQINDLLLLAVNSTSEINA